LPTVHGSPIAPQDDAGPIGGGFGADGIPDQSPVMLKTPSKILGDNLTDAKEPSPGTGYQPHHIIPWNDSRARDLQQLLKECNIDIDGASNGIWLPINESYKLNNETPHNQTQRDSYFEYLEKQFLGASASDPADVAARLAEVKVTLKNGSVYFPTKKETR
jgi:hypothetical protein